MEKAILNVDNLYISQGMNSSFSHKGDYAIDITNLKYLKAPFTGKIKRIYKSVNAVWLESVNKVEYSDGTKDYMTIMTLHSNDISKLKVGQIIKQGTIYYKPGTKGKVTGSHIHLAIGKGKYKSSGWHLNEYKNWVINNQYKVNKALFLGNNVKVTKGLYTWTKDKKEKRVTYVVKKGDYLIKIGEKYKVKWQDIAKLNNIKPPYILKVGQKLIIK